MSTPVSFEIAHTWDTTPATPAERASVTVERVPHGLRLRIDAPFHGDPPPPGPSGPTDGLWAYEVVELFIVGAGADGVPEYTEVEVGPHGHHLVLRLRGRRQAYARCLPLSVTVERAGARWTAVAHLPDALLPPPPHTANAFALHGVGESRRYLCATPTGGAQPDFHRLETFPAVDLG